MHLHTFLTVLLQLVFVFLSEYIFFTPFNICALWMLERPNSKNNFSKLPFYIIFFGRHGITFPFQLTVVFYDVTLVWAHSTYSTS